MPVSPSTENYSLPQGEIHFRKVGETAFRHVGNVPEASVELQIERLDHFSRMGPSRAKDKSVVRTKSGTINMSLEEITPENLEFLLMGTASAAAVNLSTTVDTTNGDATISGLAAVTGLVAGRRYNIVGTDSGSPIPTGVTFVFDGVDGGEMDDTADATVADTAVTITGARALEIFGVNAVEGEFRYVGTGESGPKLTLELNNVSITPGGALDLFPDEWASLPVTGELLAGSQAQLQQFGHAYLLDEGATAWV